MVFVVMVAANTGGCKHSEPEGLQFVGGDRLERGGSGAKNVAVVTHGWMEKGKNDWPEDMAKAILRHVDSNDWLCGYFDWTKGAKTISPADAATCARDIAGAALAGQILKHDLNLEHIHLIGHSCGAWTISESAKILVRQTNADVHLTFLDAYVPKHFSADLLGDINTPADRHYWADHYFTRDYTLEFTEHNLKHAHNVDVTQIDQIIKDHNFPWKWYYATIAGRFPKWSFMNDNNLVTEANGIEYGFARSKEASNQNWSNSLTFKTGNEAVTIKK